MNRHTPILVTRVAAALLLLLCSASAKEEREEPPADPQIAKLPPKITWVITYDVKEPEESDGKTPRVIKAIRTVKSGPLRCISSTWTTGAKTETWFMENTFLIKDTTKTGGSIRVIDVDPEKPFIPLPTDLAELQWVNRGNFVKSANFDGRKCHIYEAMTGSVSPGQESGGSAATLRKHTAWIDPETRLPVAHDDGETRTRYKFSDFTGTISLPPDLKSALDALKEREARDAIRRARLP